MYYDYVAATVGTQWQLDHYVWNDLEQLARQYQRTERSSRVLQIRDPIQNDLDSRIAYAFDCDEQIDHVEPESVEAMPVSMHATPEWLYEDAKRFAVSPPPVTVVRYRSGEGIKAGWLAEAREE